jgi:hypothetical protein
MARAMDGWAEGRSGWWDDIMAMQRNRDGEEGEGEREKEREGERVRMRRLGVCGEVVAVHHPGSDRFGGRAWVA